MQVYARARAVRPFSIAPNYCQWTATPCQIGCPFFCGGCTFAIADKPQDIANAKRIVPRDWYLETVLSVLNADGD